MKKHVATWQHMGTPRGVARVYTCVYACARLCACDKRDKLPFFRITLRSMMRISYIHIRFLSSSSCWTIFMFLCVHVTWCRVERLICVLKGDHRSSLKARVRAHFYLLA